MTTTPESVESTELPPPPSNRYTADAEARMARIREMADEFPDEADPALLSPAEMRLARSTSAEAIEKAAVFVHAAPDLGSLVADTVEMRDAIAFEQAYAGVRDEARSLARRVDRAIMRRKLKSSRVARGVYRLAKGYITMPQGDALRTHVRDLKLTITKPRRKKVVPPPVVPQVEVEPPPKQE